MGQTTSSVKNVAAVIASLVLLFPVAAQAFPEINYDIFRSNMAELVHLLVAASYVVGIWLGVTAFIKLKKVGEQRMMMMGGHHGMGAPLFLLLISVILIYLPNVLNAMLETMWGYNQSGIEFYPMDVSPDWENQINIVLDVIRVFGLVAFIRGWVILSRMGHEQGGHQPGVFTKGLMHIVGGILAVNVMGTIDMMKATLGM